MTLSDKRFEEWVDHMTGTKLSKRLSKAGVGCYGLSLKEKDIPEEDSE